MKDDSASHAVFTEQGSSASHMTAAKSHGYHFIATQVAQDKQLPQYLLTLKSRWKRLRQSLKTHKIGMSRHVDTSTTTQIVLKSWSIMEDPVVPLEQKICMVILWQDCCGKGQYEKILVEHGWELVPNWECLFVHRQKGLFLSVYVDDIKLAAREENINPMWKVLNKEVDLGEPTSFLDQVYLGCTQRHRETCKHIVDNY